MVSMVIGGSVALAFSLVGALSIVRFRTVVEDTRDTAFVIFAVIVGMAAGAGQLLVPLIGMPMVGVVAIALGRVFKDHLERANLTVRLGLGRSAEQLLHPVLDQYRMDYQLKAASTAKQGAAVELVYAISLPESAAIPGLLSQLNQIDGIQGIEIRKV